MYSCNACFTFDKLYFLFVLQLKMHLMCVFFMIFCLKLERFGWVILILAFVMPYSVYSTDNINVLNCIHFYKELLTDELSFDSANFLKIVMLKKVFCVTSFQNFSPLLKMSLHICILNYILILFWNLSLIDRDFECHGYNCIVMKCFLNYYKHFWRCIQI